MSRQQAGVGITVLTITAAKKLFVPAHSKKSDKRGHKLQNHWQLSLKNSRDQYAKYEVFDISKIEKKKGLTGLAGLGSN